MIFSIITILVSVWAALGGLVVIMLAIGPKVRGLIPGRGRWTFKGDKNPYHYFLWRGTKSIGSMF
jgi:hypothetical protein